MSDEDCVILVVMLIAVILTMLLVNLVSVKSSADSLLELVSIQYFGWRTTFLILVVFWQSMV